MHFTSCPGPLITETCLKLVVQHYGLDVPGSICRPTAIVCGSWCDPGLVCRIGAYSGNSPARRYANRKLQSATGFFLLPFLLAVCVRTPSPLSRVALTFPHLLALIPHRAYALCTFHLMPPSNSTRRTAGLPAANCMHDYWISVSRCKVLDLEARCWLMCRSSPGGYIIASASSEGPSPN